MTALAVDGRDLRIAGGLMLGAAAVVPLLPDGVGIPCPLRAMTGVPCPLCGMTTSVVAATHLDLASAVAANPFGPIAVIVAVVLLVVPGLAQQVRRVPPWSLGIALAASWLWQIQRFDLL